MWIKLSEAVRYIYTHTEVRPHVWRFRVWKMLTVVGRLYCVGFIMHVGVIASIWRERLALTVGPS
jgi:uncharacterized BrkB/YihY/UPF0761 family membrane protein